MAVLFEGQRRPGASRGIPRPCPACSATSALPTTTQLRCVSTCTGLLRAPLLQSRRRRTSSNSPTTTSATRPRLPDQLNRREQKVCQLASWHRDSFPLVTDQVCFAADAASIDAVHHEHARLVPWGHHTVCSSSCRHLLTDRRHPAHCILSCVQASRTKICRHAGLGHNMLCVRVSVTSMTD